MDLLIEPHLRLFVAVVIGGLIGLDRAYRGRAAGFRTHILVCLASCLLMVLMDVQWGTIPEQYIDMIRMDPARMGQGIMTGIGFLGAGVIMQERESVRGLTTAASIWVTAAIGIVIGAGFYGIAILSALLTLITLALFNRLIDILPMRRYAILVMRFSREDYWLEQQVRQTLARHHMVVSNFSYKLDSSGKSLSYQMTVRTTCLENIQQLAQALLAAEKITEFSLRPLGD